MRAGNAVEGVGRVFLYTDNARCYRPWVAVAAIHKEGLELLEHPPYSSDLAQSDSQILQKLKKHRRERILASDKEMTRAADARFKENGHAFFQEVVEIRIAGTIAFDVNEATLKELRRNRRIYNNVMRVRADRVHTNERGNHIKKVS